MVQYIVTVYTDHQKFATTANKVSIRLVGTDGESQRKMLNTAEFHQGKPSTLVIHSPKSLGRLEFIELENHYFILADGWLVDKVEVQKQHEERYQFPIYSWLTDNHVHRFREGRALRYSEDTDIGKHYRRQELRNQKETYQWNEKTNPNSILPKNPNNPFSLPHDEQFSFIKGGEFLTYAALGLLALKLDGLEDCKDNWESIHKIKKVFKKVLKIKPNEQAEYTNSHWEKDDFFGYQFLNGVNPMMIELCTVLPDNFPVTDDMVFPDGKTSLAKEMQNGNIFLVNYKNLDGFQANVINDKQQYLMAPLVLLHNRQTGAQTKLMPIAIQLKQKPADDNPIFLPTDKKYDWLLAKLFVRSADFNEHELNYHLLRTHLLAEVFTMAMHRNLPMVHPLYKLLSPHTRYTLEINMLARMRLISPKGVFTKFAALGGKDMIPFLNKSLSSITYESLCIKEDIARRGMEKIPDFYYRDDGCELWDILERFVDAVLRHYYRTDAEVVHDFELQRWIQDINENGCFSQQCAGIPTRFDTVAEMVKFVTMVIFTCSCQHAAVNNGQFEYNGWMPNTPLSLKRPPPTTKGKANEDTLMKTLPDVNATAQQMFTVWLLSKQSTDFVPFGHYPEERFTEEEPQKMIVKFQRELHALRDKIKKRNKKMKIPYTYLDPQNIENSVSL